MYVRIRTYAKYIHVHTYIHAYVYVYACVYRRIQRAEVISVRKRSLTMEQLILLIDSDQRPTDAKDISGLYTAMLPL